MYPPATTHAALSAFFDALTQTIGPLCVNNLCIFCGDLNRINTRPFTLFGLHDIVNFPTRLDSQLDHIFVSDETILLLIDTPPWEPQTTIL